MTRGEWRVARGEKREWKGECILTGDECFSKGNEALSLTGSCAAVVLLLPPLTPFSHSCSRALTHSTHTDRRNEKSA